MNDYTKEKINVALAKAAECLRDDPARAEKYLGRIKTWVNESTDGGPARFGTSSRPSVVKALADAAENSAKGAGDVALRHNWNEHLIEHNAPEYQHDFALFKVVEAYVLKHLADRQQRGGEMDERAAFEAWKAERLATGYGFDAFDIWQARAALAATKGESNG